MKFGRILPPMASTRTPHSGLQTLLARLSVAQVWKNVYGLDLARRNARYLEIEIFWAAFLSAAATFGPAFALRLGATNQEIGLLSSLPALLALLVTIPAGHFLSRRAHLMPWLTGSLFVYRLGFLMVALVPWLPVEEKGALLVWLLVIFTLPAHFFGVGWNSMLADVIPEVERSKVFAIRNGISALALTGGIYLCGVWLEAAPFPLNYQVMFGVGFLTSLLSIYYIIKVKIPEQLPARLPEPKSAPFSLWKGMQALFSPTGKVRSHPDFLRIVVNTLLHGIGLWMIAPLYVLYFVRGLGASEGWLGLNGMLANLTPVLGYYVWQRAIVRWGENPVLKWSIVLVGAYPLLVGLTDNLTLILLWGALNGLIVPGVGLSHFPMLLKICPAEDRPLYMGIYTTIMNGGATVMPLAGVALAEIFGMAPVLIAGGLLCVAGSASFVTHPLRTADSLAARRVQQMESQLERVPA